MSVTCQLLTADFPALPRPNRRIPAKYGRGLAGKAVTLLVRGTGRDFEIFYKAFRGRVECGLLLATISWRLTNASFAI